MTRFNKSAEICPRLKIFRQKFWSGHRLAVSCTHETSLRRSNFGREPNCWLTRPEKASLISGRRDLNSDYMIPNHGCYRYTTPRRNELQIQNFIKQMTPNHGCYRGIYPTNLRQTTPSLFFKSIPIQKKS